MTQTQIAYAIAVSEAALEEATALVAFAKNLRELRMHDVLVVQYPQVCTMIKELDRCLTLLDTCPGQLASDLFPQVQHARMQVNAELRKVCDRLPKSINTLPEALAYTQKSELELHDLARANGLLRSEVRFEFGASLQYLNAA